VKKYLENPSKKKMISAEISWEVKRKAMSSSKNGTVTFPVRAVASLCVM
jgi:hypothetical protein